MTTRMISFVLVWCTIILIMMNISPPCDASFIITTTNAPPRPRLYSLSLLENKDNNEIASSSSSSSWTLEEDWALIDRVPQFTIGNKQTMVRTFWTQLWISTPELSRKENSDVLRQRYEMLQESEQINKNDNNNNNQTTTKSKTKFVAIGPSPQVLDEWSINVSTNQITGQLDGRTVWFVAQLIGRLRDNESVQQPSSATTQPQPGDYVEAIGNRIYELGQPSSLSSTITTTTTAAAAMTENDGATTSIAAANENKSMENNNNNNPPSWLTTGVTASISAFLSATVLSAAIGYGAGIGIISDSSSISSNNNKNTAVPPVQLVETTTTTTATTAPKATTSGMINSRATLPSSSRYRSIVEEPSITEKRARTEANVLREERILRGITERLSRDQSDLVQLQKLEKEPTSIVLSNNNNNDNNKNEPSISEKRARKEMWVLREERDIKRISNQLQQDQIKLRELRQQEQQQ